MSEPVNPSVNPSVNPTAEEVVKPLSFREYLHSSAESIGVFTWLLRRVNTKESKVHLKTLFASLVASIVVMSVQPSFVSYVFDGLRLKNEQFVFWGIIAFSASLFLQKTLQRSFDRAREWILGIHMGKLDDMLSEHFFEKSLGQHAQLSNLLSPATIDKGKWKALDMLRILLFDGTSTIMQLSVSIGCLFFLNWVAGAIMLGVLCFYIVGSLYLNRQVANITTPLTRGFAR